MSTAASDSALSSATSSRHRLGAMLILLVVTLVTALFWAAVIHLIVTA